MFKLSGGKTAKNYMDVEISKNEYILTVSFEKLGKSIFFKL
jgi:hypothetical protein